MQNNRLVFVIPLLFFVVLALVLWNGIGKDPTHLDSQLIGKPIPKFHKPLLLDAQRFVDESAIKGPALVNIFASWCPSCYNEHPNLMQLSGSKTVRIYGVDYKDSREKGLKFINDLGNPYELVIFDENGRLGIDLGVYGAPETFVVNAENQVVYRHVGIVNLDVWQSILKPKMFAANGELNSPKSAGNP